MGSSQEPWTTELLKKKTAPSLSMSDTVRSEALHFINSPGRAGSPRSDPYYCLECLENSHRILRNHAEGISLTSGFRPHDCKKKQSVLAATRGESIGDSPVSLPGSPILEQYSRPAEWPKGGSGSISYSVSVINPMLHPSPLQSTTSNPGNSSLSVESACQPALKRPAPTSLDDALFNESLSVSRPTRLPLKARKVTFYDMNGDAKTSDSVAESSSTVSRSSGTQDDPIHIECSSQEKKNLFVKAIKCKICEEIMNRDQGDMKKHFVRVHKVGLSVEDIVHAKLVCSVTLTPDEARKKKIESKRKERRKSMSQPEEVVPVYYPTTELRLPQGVWKRGPSETPSNQQRDAKQVSIAKPGSIFPQGMAVAPPGSDYEAGLRQLAQRQFSAASALPWTQPFLHPSSYGQAETSIARANLSLQQGIPMNLQIGKMTFSPSDMEPGPKVGGLKLPIVNQGL